MDGGQGRVLDATSADRVPGPLVALASEAARDIEGVVEVGVADVQLVRVNADNRPVLAMHLLHDPDVLAATNDVMIELRPIGVG